MPPGSVMHFLVSNKTLTFPTYKDVPRAPASGDWRALAASCRQSADCQNLMLSRSDWAPGYGGSKRFQGGAGGRGGGEKEGMKNRGLLPLGMLNSRF